jgi:hypothetical protein
VVDVAAARARCEAATPGPWIASDDSEPLRIGSHGEYPPAYVPRTGRRYVLGMDAAGRPYQPFERDAAFIAHARTDLPAALDTIEAQEANLREMGSREEDMEAEIERLGGEIATLRAHLTEQQRAFVTALEFSQRKADEEMALARAEIDDLRAENGYLRSDLGAPK